MLFTFDKRFLVTVIAICLTCRAVWGHAAEGPTPAQLAMLEMMTQRVSATPNHSDSWRSLGRLQNVLGDSATAEVSIRRAIELDPHNAAAHFDLGNLLATTSRNDQARIAFDRVFAIAPASSYADQLRQKGIAPRPNAASHLNTAAAPQPRVTLGAPSAVPSIVGLGLQGPESLSTGTMPRPDWDTGAPVQPAGYQIQTFDGADDFENRVEQLEVEAIRPTNRLRVFLETGVLYNSNLTLTPVSRELAQSDGESFQFFANPDLDWKWIRTETMRLGPLFRGYFTANESDFKQFNLASFQPGAFFERDFKLGQSEAIGRLDYVFTNDYFDWNEIDHRHSATASVTVIRPDLEAFYGYLTIAQSEFRDDGATPAQTSMDGTTWTLGITRFFQTGWKSLPTHSLGLDLESADTDGDDFRYQSVNLHGSTGWLISERLKLIPTWGAGYRSYADFTDPVGRDELFWRVHGRLQYALNDSVAIALVAGHDRFASENDFYDTERTEGGLIFTLTR